MTSAKMNDAAWAARTVRSLLLRFLDGQDAIQELSAFAADQGLALDSDDAAARRLARIALPADMPQEHASDVYRAAQTYLREQRASLKSAQAKAKEVVASGGDEEAVGKARRDTFRESYTAALTSFQACLQDLGVSPKVTFEVQQYVHQQTRRPRLPVMLESLLGTAVNDFESFFAGLARTSYEFDPATLKSSDREYTWSEVSSYSSIEEFTDFAIDNQVDALMSKSVSDWTSFILRATRLEKSLLEPLALDVTEIIQRRHVITHAGGLASRRYLEKTKGLTGAGTKQGERLGVSPDYLGDALDRLARLALTLAFASIHAILAKSRSEERPEYLREVLLNLLKSGRYKCVAPMWDVLRDRMPDASSVEVLRVNCWIARSRLHGPETIRKEVKDWDVSNLTSNLQLAKFVLLADLNRAERMVQTQIDRNLLSEYEVQTWPLLEPLRQQFVDKAVASRGGAVKAVKTAASKTAASKTAASKTAASKTAASKT